MKDFLTQYVKNKAKNFFKKGLNKAGKAAGKAIAKALKLLVQFLLRVVGLSGISFTSVGCSTFGIVIVIMLIVTSIFSFGGGSDDDISEGTQENINRINSEVNQYVNLNHPVEKEYRLNPGLIALTVQLDMYKGEDEDALISDMAEELSPSFTYETYTPKKKITTTFCKNGECETTEEIVELEPVSRIVHVDAWNGKRDMSYELEWGNEEVVSEREWEEESTRTEQRVETVTKVNWITEEKEVTDTRTVEKVIRIPVLDPGYFGPPKYIEKVVEVEEEYTYTIEVQKRVEEDIEIIVDEEVAQVDTFKETVIEQVQSVEKVTDTTTEDYERLERVLFEYDYDRDDIIFIETIYNTSLSAENGSIQGMRYSDWLASQGYDVVGNNEDSGISSPGSSLPSLPEVSDGTFTAPTTGFITSGYGVRSGGMHYGIDIGKGGRPYDVGIVSVADGVVNRSYYSDSYGNTVFIIHNINGVQYETIYAHMVNRYVSAGERVEKGQTIGIMGNTGRSFGAHLHFEIHLGNWTLNKQNSFNPLMNNQGITFSIKPDDWQL